MLVHFLKFEMKLSIRTKMTKTETEPKHLNSAVKLLLRVTRHFASGTFSEKFSNTNFTKKKKSEAT